MTKNLSRHQLQALKLFAEGYEAGEVWSRYDYGLSGNHALAFRNCDRTIDSLEKRGLLSKDHKITPEGKKLLWGDSVCKCVHWFEEHDEEGVCAAPGCDCEEFEPDAELNTPQNIADRGGEHTQPCNCNDCRSLRGQPLREF